MLLLSNLFPFVNMNVAGVTSEVTLLENSWRYVF
ncbi:paraquat-inducible protein A [Salmonella bongori]|nr:paraquat-inducible protein A [Salmonella bongori]